MPLPCRAENLFPVQLKKHRPAGLQSENARDDADVQSGILLTAEAASDERAHHMQLVLRDAEYRSQIPPGGVDGLRRTCQRQTACKRIRLSDADVRLKVTVFHHRRLVVVFDDDGRIPPNAFSTSPQSSATVVSRFPRSATGCFSWMRVAPSSMASRGSSYTGRGSYSTRTSSTAFRAASSVSAARIAHRVAFVAGLHVRNDRLVRTQQPIGVPPR